MLINSTDTSIQFTPASSLNITRKLAVSLLIGDLVGLFLLFISTYFFRFGQLLNWLNPYLFGTAILILSSFYIVDAYRPELRIAGLWAPARTFLSCLFVSILLAAFSYLFQATDLSPLLWRSALLPGIGLFAVWAVILRIVASSWARSSARQNTCLLLGTDTHTWQFEQDFSTWNPLGKLVILSDRHTSSHTAPKPTSAIQGSLEDLQRWAGISWSGVVVSPQISLPGDFVEQLMQLRLKGTPIYKLPDFYEVLWQKLPPVLLQDTWFAFGGGFSLLANRTNLKLKRLIDVVMAIALLSLLSPIMLVTALAIRLESPGPIFYSQWRTGLNNQPFRVYKFRSMRQDAEKLGVQWAKERDPRITRVGYWIRLVRIDELPQFWNVLRGEMSLIGPRPERPEFDQQLSAAIPYYSLRYLVKPGITGWAQVMYPYGASIEDAYQKLSYDLYYIKNYSIWLDLSIVFKTVRVVLLGKGR